VAQERRSVRGLVRRSGLHALLDDEPAERHGRPVERVQGRDLQGRVAAVRVAQCARQLHVFGIGRLGGVHPKSGRGLRRLPRALREPFRLSERRRASSREGRGFRARAVRDDVQPRRLLAIRHARLRHREPPRPRRARGLRHAVRRASRRSPSRRAPSPPARSARRAR